MRRLHQTVPQSSLNREHRLEFYVRPVGNRLNISTKEVKQSSLQRWSVGSWKGEASERSRKNLCLRDLTVAGMGTKKTQLKHLITYEVRSNSLCMGG